MQLQCTVLQLQMFVPDSLAHCAIAATATAANRQPQQWQALGGSSHKADLECCGASAVQNDHQLFWSMLIIIKVSQHAMIYLHSKRLAQMR